MSPVGIGVRVAIQVALFAALAPLVSLSNRRGWRLSGTLPVLFHRAFLRLFGIRVTVRGRPPGRRRRWSCRTTFPGSTSR
jgi:1-acyl-sn-glycerol-3-phosphate acyltransferase